jgi:hypothetical protein
MRRLELDIAYYPVPEVMTVSPFSQSIFAEVGTRTPKGKGERKLGQEK